MLCWTFYYSFRFMIDSFSIFPHSFTHYFASLIRIHGPTGVNLFISRSGYYSLKVLKRHRVARLGEAYFTRELNLGWWRLFWQLWVSPISNRARSLNLQALVTAMSKISNRPVSFLKEDLAIQWCNLEINCTTCNIIMHFYFAMFVVPLSWNSLLKVPSTNAFILMR